jgi:hypothetical protein
LSGVISGNARNACGFVLRAKNRRVLSIMLGMNDMEDGI